MELEFLKTLRRGALIFQFSEWKVFIEIYGLWDIPGAGRGRHDNLGAYFAVLSPIKQWVVS
jgi:hypothetical protein